MELEPADKKRTTGRRCSPVASATAAMVGGGALIIIGIVVSRVSDPARLSGRPRIMRGDESLMTSGKHGSCVGPVQSPLRWGCSVQTSDQICCFNRHFAEYAGYWETTSFMQVPARTAPRPSAGHTCCATTRSRQ